MASGSTEAIAREGPRASEVSPESRRTLATASMSGSASAASTAALAAAWGSSTSVLTAKSADTPNSLGVWRRWLADAATVHTAIAPVTARGMPRTPDHAAARARSPAGLRASRTPNATWGGRGPSAPRTGRWASRRAGTASIQPTAQAAADAISTVARKPPATTATSSLIPGSGSACRASPRGRNALARAAPITAIRRHAGAAADPVSHTRRTDGVEAQLAPHPQAVLAGRRLVDHHRVGRPGRPTRDRHAERVRRGAANRPEPEQTLRLRVRRDPPGRGVRHLLDPWDGRGLVDQFNAPGQPSGIDPPAIGDLGDRDQLQVGLPRRRAEPFQGAVGPARPGERCHGRAGGQGHNGGDQDRRTAPTPLAANPQPHGSHQVPLMPRLYSRPPDQATVPPTHWLGWLTPPVPRDRRRRQRASGHRLRGAGGPVGHPKPRSERRHRLPCHCHSTFIRQVIESRVRTQPGTGR